jgi:hypothetical protein
VLSGKTWKEALEFCCDVVPRYLPTGCAEKLDKQGADCGPEM